MNIRQLYSMKTYINTSFVKKLPDQFCCERSTDMYFEHSKNDSVDCTSVFQSLALETAEGARALLSFLFLENFYENL